jgi:hypothetical protein
VATAFAKSDVSGCGRRAWDETPGDLLSAVSNVAKGKTLDLEIVRDSKTLALNAKLTTDPVGVKSPPPNVRVPRPALS